ncbi:translation initiation factor 2A [Trypanosoma rangeli]|uniref:Translation initiation factor 2A n=1 Tax=Trypanosoma rangeli TaxID=5698 RepID=A0A422N2R4_TRYRA|nr:translation initiation factor 2A [Trypanosoma rangeli]RNE99740.1 translation initiation factor 2A [Trypanosoma rangeli]|eukprot:RNE99740.1 translation initiation factor 2A [Trypanosoma rangeli]
MQPPAVATHPVGAAALPIILRKDDNLVLATFSEQQRILTEVESTLMTGDYRECEVQFNPVKRTAFAHATTMHVRYSELVPTQDATAWGLRLLFEVEERNVVALSFSTLGTILVTYAMMDSKRPEGNMSLYDVSTGNLLRRCVQARWPGMVWSSEELYCVRPVQGFLHVMDGNLRREDVPVLAKMDLHLPQDKEIELSMCPGNIPLLALFKPFHKQVQGTLFIYRLPNLLEGAMYQVPFGRAESATVLWSRSGNHLALQVKSESDKSGKSYYGTVRFFLVNVIDRSVKEIKFPNGESVHDCQWSPSTDQVMVIHGTMPRNKTTLYDKAGVALMTFDEAPRNVILWAPNGRFCALGGTGNLAGDFVFYDLHPAEGNEGIMKVNHNDKNKMTPTTLKPAAAAAISVGGFNEKSSVQTWAPDSHNFLCATVFTRLRIDNKLVFFKKNGEHLMTQKYPFLYGAYWVQTQDTNLYPQRPASPCRETNRPAKPQPYRPPHASAAAAALLRRPDSSTPKQGKPAGPPGATVVVQKKKKR